MRERAHAQLEPVLRAQITSFDIVLKYVHRGPKFGWAKSRVGHVIPPGSGRVVKSQSNFTLQVRPCLHGHAIFSALL